MADHEETARALDLADRVALLSQADQDGLEAALKGVITTQRLDENADMILQRRRDAVTELLRRLESPVLGLV